MEYRFPSGTISFMYDLIQNKSVMFDEITLRIFSRLIYFKERPYPYYNENEFNELNIYLSVACGEDQERRREARSAIGLISPIGEAFFKKWGLGIIESSVWAVSENGAEKVKLYDFGTEVVRGALLEKTEGRRNPLIKRICDFLSKESFSEGNLLLLILSAFLGNTEWALPQGLLLHWSSRSFLLWLQKGEGDIRFGIVEEKLTLIRDENRYWNSSEKPILEVPLNKIRKEFNQDVIRIFQG